MLHKNKILTVSTYPSHITLSLTHTHTHTKQQQKKPFAKSLGGNRITFNAKVVMIPVFLLLGLEYWEEIKQHSQGMGSLVYLAVLIGVYVHPLSENTILSQC